MRTRDLDAGFLAEISKPAFFPVTLVSLDWPSGIARAHSGVGPLVWGGDTFNGVGNFGAITLPNETQSGAARRLVLSLYGAPADSLSDINHEDLRGREGIVYAGAVSEAAGNSLIGEPAEVFSGTIDVSRFRMSSEDVEGRDVLQTVIQVEVVSGPPLRRKASFYHTQEDQQAAHPTDTAGRHVQAAQTNAFRRRWPE